MNPSGTGGRVERNRRFVVMFLAALLVLAVSWLVRPRTESTVAAPAPASTPTASVPVSSQTTPPRTPSERTRLTPLARLTGKITPKSVATSGQGLVAAANMMYGHTISLYRPDGTAQGAIPDAVELTRFGVGGHPGTVRGAPVEVAFSADGSRAYATNYAMYGAGFGAEPKDACTPTDKVQPSYLYRLDMTKRVIDGATRVGSVPKSVAVTPDGRTVLVANWCSRDISVVDTTRSAVVATVRVDGQPLGLAVSPDGRTAYLGLIGRNKVVTLDLATVAGGLTQAQDLAGTDAGPRHLTISPDGRYLFVACNDAGTVIKLDSSTGAVLARHKTGGQPRALAVAPDGTAVFAATYAAGTVAKLRAADLAALGEVKTDPSPTSVAYEPTLGRVWVACYSGSLMVFDDTGTVPAGAGGAPPTTPATATVPSSVPTTGTRTATGTTTTVPAPSSPARSR